MRLERAQISQAFVLHAAFGIGYYSICSHYNLLAQKALRYQTLMFAISTSTHTLLQSPDSQGKLNSTDIIPFALITLAKVQQVTWKIQALCTVILSSVQITVNHSLIQDSSPPSLKKNRKTEWLSNIDIQKYSEYLETQNPHLFAAFPFSHDLNYLEQVVLDAMNKGTEKTIFSFPLHVGKTTKNHWTLLYINTDLRVVEYYDSKTNYGNYEEVVRTLEALTQTLNKQFPSEKPYTFQCKIQKYLQPDIYQCGVWTLYFLEKLIEDPQTDFNALDIAEAQKMIAKHRLDLIPCFPKKDWDF